MSRSRSLTLPRTNVQRTPSWSTDPDACALQALTQALDVGKKLLRDRMDKIPDVQSDNTSAGRESWRLSLHNHAQWNPKVSQRFHFRDLTGHLKYSY